MPIQLPDTDDLKLNKRKKSPDGYSFEYLGYRGRGGLLGEIFGMRRRYETQFLEIRHDIPNSCRAQAQSGCFS